MTPEIAEPAGQSSAHHDTHGSSRGYVAPSQFRVTLTPLTVAGDPDGSPAGCLARPQVRSDSADPVTASRAELAVLMWTMMSVEVIHPDAFLVVPVTPEMVLSPSFRRTVGHLPCHRLLLVFETARLGGRLMALKQAVVAARRFGIEVAVRGNRLVAAEGFDAVLVEPTSSAIGPPMVAHAQVIAIGLRTESDVAWALTMGASLLEGPGVGGSHDGGSARPASLQPGAIETGP